MLEIKWKKKLKLNCAMYYSVVANLYKFYYSLGLNIFMVMFQPLNNFHCFVSFFLFSRYSFYYLGNRGSGIGVVIQDIRYCTQLKGFFWF